LYTSFPSIGEGGFLTGKICDYIEDYARRRSEDERKCSMTRDLFRKQLVDMYAEGRSVDEICAEHNVPKSTFYRWIRKSRGEQPDISEEDIRMIVTRIEELEEEATTYKKVLQLLKKVEK
jgi:transposase-like protein